MLVPVVQAAGGCTPLPKVLGPAALTSISTGHEIGPVSGAFFNGQCRRLDPHTASTLKRFDSWAFANQDALQDYFQRKLSYLGIHERRPLMLNAGSFFLLGLNLFLNMGDVDDPKSLRDKFISSMDSRPTLDEGEFLEKILMFSSRMVNPPSNMPDVLARGRHYFDCYSNPEEEWCGGCFKKSILAKRELLASYEDPAEYLVIDILAPSRALFNFERVKKPPRSFTTKVEAVNEYFQTAFGAVFGIPPPIDLSTATYLLDDGHNFGRYVSCADKVSSRSYISRYDIQKHGPDKIRHLIIHEGLHLCISTVSCGGTIEDAYIESLISRMIDVGRPPFRMSPLSEGYQYDMRVFEALCRAMPGALQHFDAYFMRGDEESLRTFLKKNYSTDVSEGVLEEIRGGNNWSVLRAIEYLIDPQEASLNRPPKFGHGIRKK